MNELKLKVIKLREQGLSYSAIKEEVKVSKSTLSLWLRDMPLSRDEINNLRARSPLRIEKYRVTMEEKRNSRKALVLDIAKKEIGKLSRREIFLAGLFLYWGEGGKTNPYVTTLSNTDPAMIKFYLRWLSVLKVPKNKIRVRLHLYGDMNVERELTYWIQMTRLDKSQFRKPAIKRGNLNNLSRTGFGHGTCDVMVGDRDLAEHVSALLKSIAT